MSLRRLTFISAFLGSFAAPSFTGATVIMKNIVIVPSDVQIVIGSGGKTASYRNLFEFRVFDGDSIDVMAALTAPMTIADLGTGSDNLEHLFFGTLNNFGFGDGSTFTYSFEFTGVSGSVLTNPITGSQLFDGNLTDSSFSFTGMHFLVAASNPTHPGQSLLEGFGFGFDFTADEVDMPGARSCGNGKVDTQAEQCDEGSANGGAGSCCNSDCTLQPAGHVCRPQASFCDAAETCTGTTGACPADGFAAPGTPCVDGDPCTVEDSCQAGQCAGTRVCSVDVEVVRNSLGVRSAKKRKVQVNKAPFVVTCHSLNTGEAQRGSCGAQGVLSEPPSAMASGSPHGSSARADYWPLVRSEVDGVGSCNTGTVITNSRSLHFNQAGIAIVKLKLNPLGRRALKKLIDKEPVIVTICVTVTRPDGAEIKVADQAELISPCPGGRSSSVCGIVTPAKRARP